MTGVFSSLSPFGFLVWMLSPHKQNDLMGSADLKEKRDSKTSATKKKASQIKSKINLNSKN